MQDNMKQIHGIIKKHDNNNNNIIRLIHYVNGTSFGLIYCKLKTFPDIKTYHAR